MASAKLFSIDPQQRIIIEGDTKTTLNIPLVNVNDLRNENHYNKNGELIHEAENPKDYDFEFAIRLKQIYPLYECEPFLNYHYNITTQKDLFLKHIEFFTLLYPFLKNEQPTKVEFIKDWIKRMKQGEPPQKKLALESIFIESNNSFELCKELFEYLEITIDGIPKISKGRIGKITGLITALKETPNIFKLEKSTLTESFLLDIFNKYLSTDFKTFSKRNELYKETYDTAIRYLKQNPPKVK